MKVRKERMAAISAAAAPQTLGAPFWFDFHDEAEIAGFIMSREELHLGRRPVGRRPCARG